MISNDEVWLRFACAALPAAMQTCVVDPVHFATKFADEMMVEWDKRYGRLKFILDGIRDCIVCSKILNENDRVIVAKNKDGYCKLCGNQECSDLLMRTLQEEMNKDMVNANV